MKKSKTISKAKKEQLEALRLACDVLGAIQNGFVDAAEAITGEKDGFTFDYIMNEFGTVEELLANLNIKVK